MYMYCKYYVCVIAQSPFLTTPCRGWPAKKITILYSFKMKRYSEFSFLIEEEIETTTVITTTTVAPTTTTEPKEPTTTTEYFSTSERPTTETTATTTPEPITTKEPTNTTTADPGQIVITTEAIEQGKNCSHYNPNVISLLLAPQA